jgi:hypothetical protein
MIKSIKDNVMNQESYALLKAVVNGRDYKGAEVNLYGDVTIEQNMNSGWIYAVDEDYNGCYLFSDNDCKELEAHYSCPNCGYENFERQFANEATESCCFEYAKDMELVEPDFLEELSEEEEGKTIVTQAEIDDHLRPAF